LNDLIKNDEENSDPRFVLEEYDSITQLRASG